MAKREREREREREKERWRTRETGKHILRFLLQFRIGWANNIHTNTIKRELREKAEKVSEIQTEKYSNVSSKGNGQRSISVPSIYILYIFIYRQITCYRSDGRQKLPVPQLGKERTRKTDEHEKKSE